MRHKTITLAAVTFLAVTGTTFAQANALTPTEQARAFATCAGRLQALAARQGAIQDPGSEATRRMQGDFEALLDAVLPALTDRGVGPREARRWRAHGWVEIALLLRREQYTPNAARAQSARADRARRIHTCRRMILPG